MGWFSFSTGHTLVIKTAKSFCISHHNKHFLKEKQALDLKGAKERDPDVESGCWKQTCLRILTLSGKLSVFVVPCKLDFDMKEH